MSNFHQMLEVDEMDESTLEKFIKLVHLYTGITMSFSKKSLLQGRIRPRLKKLGLTTYQSYLDLISENKDERQEFINIVTTHETSFFRTARIWEYFCNEFLPAWFTENQNRSLKIWSAAASTGEESYTIAICCEEFREKNPKFDYQIIATDISTDVIETAKDGVYSGRSIENFKSNNLLFKKYMIQGEDGFKIKSNTKLKIKFGTHNLYHLSKESDFDIVFIRNVLIYFKPSDQEIVLANIRQAMRNEGILILGESESLNALKTPFDYLVPLVYSAKRN